MDNFEVECEDVLMKLFMQSLVDDVRDWYRSLLDSHIGSWNNFHRVFREKYGDHTDPRFKLGEITTIQKGQNEMATDFNTRFVKILNKIPHHVKPNDSMCLIFYMKT